MAKICSNKCVGQLIRDGQNIAIIKRVNYPEAFALPAGHVRPDEDFLQASVRETREETGVTIVENRLVFREEVDNPCQREGGSRHLWEVYEAVYWNGRLQAGSDAKACYWAAPEELKKMAERTEYFIKKYNISFKKVGKLTAAIFGADPNKKTIDLEWKEEMGLEPAWYYILKSIGVI